VGVRSTRGREVVERLNYLRMQAHLKYLQEIHQLSPASLRRYRFYLRHLLIWADDQLFRDAHLIRPTFPVYVTSLAGRDRSSLSPPSQKKIIESSKRFFVWAKANYSKEYSRLTNEWIESLRPARAPQRPQEHVFVAVDEAIHLATFPTPEDDLALHRDRAAAAMLFLSGMRASAFTTLPISAVDLSQRSIRQWPELGVLTKNGKRATTYLLPIPELHAVVQAWDELVRSQLPPTTPWYTPIEHTWGEQRLSSKEPGKNRHQALDKRLRRLFELAGLPYKSAHKFRHGHAVYGLLKAQTMADYKAVSMNLMHEDVKITDEIYAPLLSNEVEERISKLTAQPMDQLEGELIMSLNRLSNVDLAQLMVAAAHRLKSPDKLR